MFARLLRPRVRLDHGLPSIAGGARAASFPRWKNQNPILETLGFQSEIHQLPCRIDDEVPLGRCHASFPRRRRSSGPSGLLPQNPNLQSRERTSPFSLTSLSFQFVFLVSWFLLRLEERKQESKTEFVPFVIEDQVVGFIHKG